MDARSYVDLKPNPRIPDFRPGDAVRVHARVIEGERERIQVFEGVVIRIRRGGVNSSFTVRRVSHGVGVERVFPYYSPLVDKVEVTRVGRVRRARLYYLRGRKGKAARIKPGSRARFEALSAAGAVAAGQEDVEKEEAAEEELATAEEEELAEESEEVGGEEDGEAEEAQSIEDLEVEEEPEEQAPPQEVGEEPPAEVEEETRA